MGKVMFKEKKKVSYWGKGGGYCNGLDIYPYNDKIVAISPINSKNMVGNLTIEMPFEEIPNLITALKEIYYEHERTKV